jgi:hypothetical protein
MTDLTLEKLYDLVINYLTKAYGVLYGVRESNPRNYEINKLHLYIRAVTYYLDWDNDSEFCSNEFWDNTITVPRYLT